VTLVNAKKYLFAAVLHDVVILMHFISPTRLTMRTKILDIRPKNNLFNEKKKKENFRKSSELSL